MIDPSVAAALATTASMRHQNILVLGGSGFVGGHVVSALVADGRQVAVPTRRREGAKRLLLLPTIDVAECDIGDDRVLRDLMRGRTAVINLVGILHGDDAAFRAAHVELPRRIVEACRTAGVERLIQMSALGAAADAPSSYLRSKSGGEAVVDAAATGTPPLAVTVFRPSVVFGPDDRFLNLFATMQRWLPVMPLAAADARFQPVSVHDVARAFVAAIDDDESFGRTYELAGPHVYTLRELVRYAGAHRAGGGGRARPVIGLPDGLGRLQAAFLEFAPGPTLMSRDNLKSMQKPNVAAGALPGLVDLGVSPTPLDAEAPAYLERRNRRSHLDHLRRDAH